MKLKKFASTLFALILFLVASVVIYFALMPFFNWYLGKVPVLGVDIYYTATYVAYHVKHFSLAVNSFKDIWFAGSPFFLDFPQLHFYSMVPFAKHFGLIGGIQIYVLLSLFLLITSCCLLFWRLSKNIALALVLSILIFLSPNIYGAAVWGGSIPYFATQAFVPLVIFLLVSYFVTSNRRWFWLAVLISGISLSFHPLPIVSFAFPAVVFLLFLWRGSEFNYKISARTRDFFLFFGLNFLISLSLFYRPFLNKLTAVFSGDILSPFGLVSGGTSTTAAPIGADISSFYKNQVTFLKTDTNLLLFYFLFAGLAVFLIALVLFRDRMKRFGRVLPFIFFLLFTTAHVYLNAYGHNFLAQGFYRTFWAFPIALGALTAILWGEFFDGLEKFFNIFKPWLGKTLFLVLALSISAGFLYVGFLNYQVDISKMLDKNEQKLEYSSAFPESLSISVDRQSQEKLKKQLVPSFLDSTDRNKRLYASEAGVNIWWNSLFDMPLARGYLDPPIASSERGGLFWLDIAIANDSLVRDFKIDENVAYNNALFLIDWNAIYYFEGGRLSSKGVNVGPSSYLVKNNVFDKNEKPATNGLILKWQTASGKPDLRMDLSQSLNYYKVDDKFTSPVIYPSDAPVILFLGERGSYEDFLRVIATYNFNSRELIPVYGGKFIDEFNLGDLHNFDAVFLSNYTYKSRSKSFDKLEKYVKEGGKIFIDSGSDVKDSNASDLPEIFPMKSSKRTGLGKDWNPEAGDSELLKSVDAGRFGPLIFNDSEWKLSFPADDSLKSDSIVVLKQKGKPVLVQRTLGKGEVVWSGINLIYHFNQYKVIDEAKLLSNVIEKFVKIEDRKIAQANAVWLKPEKVRIETSAKPRGILFKEEGYSGWGARLVSEDNRKLPIYIAGPTYPGFMYVPLSNLKTSPVVVQFKFSGDLNAWVITLISVLSVIFVIERIIFVNRTGGSKLFIGKKWIGKKLGLWWEKEDADETNL